MLYRVLSVPGAFALGFAFVWALCLLKRAYL
jgi:hypothetical protein